MKKRLILVFTFTACLAIIGCRGRFFKDHGLKYRTTGAPEAFIGSVGLKRSARGHLFERKYVPELNSLIVKVTQLSFHEQNESTFTGKLQAEGITPVGGGLSGSRQKKVAEAGDVFLMQFKDIRSLVDELNRPNNLDFRKYVVQDSAFRIVTGVVDARSYAITNNIARSFEVKLTTGEKLIEGVTIMGNVGNSVTNLSERVYSPGTVIAYKLGRFHWQADSSWDDPKICDIMLDLPRVSDSKHRIEGCTPHKEFIASKRPDRR